MLPQDRKYSVGFLLLGLALVAVVALPAGASAQSHRTVAVKKAAAQLRNARTARAKVTRLIVHTVRINTSGAPPAPSSLRIVSTSPSSIGVAWRAPLVRAALIYRISVNGNRVGTTASAGFMISSLSCGATYSVGVRSEDLIGHVSSMTSMRAATQHCAAAVPAPAPSPPDAPTGLSVTGVSTTSVSVSWSASGQASSYGVYLDGTAAGSTSATGYTVGGLTCGTSHTIAVDVVNSGGTHSTKTAITAATAPCPPPSDGQPPTVPGSLAVTGASASTVSVSWNRSSDNVGVVSYGVYSNGKQAGSTGTTSYTISGLTCGTTYTVAVDAVDAAGNHSAKASVSVATAACPDTLAPLQPSNLHVVFADQSSLLIGWNVPLDNVGVAGYDVYLDGKLKGKVASPSFNFTGLTCGTSHGFAVDAYDAAGNVSAQTSGSASTVACSTNDTTAPSAPTAVSESSISATGLTVSWTAATDNVGVTGYTVYVNGSKSGQTAATSYPVSGLTCGTGYTLGVEAYDAAGNVSQRSTSNATTAACPGDTSAPTSPSGLTVTANGQTALSVSWSASTDNVGVAGYNVYSNGTNAGQTGGLSYALNGLTCGSTVTVAVEAYDAAGNKSAQALAAGTTAACTPTTGGGGGDTANIWIAPGGSDSGSNCKRSASPSTMPSAGTVCATMKKALQLASCGDDVKLAAGTYPSAQMVKADNPGLASGCSSYVVFEPAQGATVTLGCPGTSNVGCGPLGLGSSNWAPGCCSDGQQGPSWVEFKNFVFRGSWEVGGGDHILLENDHGPSAGNVRDTTNFTMHGGDYGPCQSPSTSPRTTPCDHNMSFDGNGASSVLIDGVTFHDFSLVNPDHFECMVVFGAASMTIQNSRFYNCMIYDVAFSLGNTPSGVVVQNNWFGDATNGWALNFMYNGHPDSNVLIRYNSFSDGNAITQSSGSLSNVRAIGNIIGAAASTNCISGLTYDYNVWDTGSCGSHSVNLGGSVSSAYKNSSGGAAGDYHLAATTLPFVQWIQPSSGDYGLMTDHDGNARTIPNTAGAQAP